VAAVTAAAPPSLWLEQVGDLTPRAALDGDIDVDVAIVGAGFTGLWTAYHLLDQDPSLRLAVVEREVAGWGASGRNGGWCSALFAVSWKRVAARHGHDAALGLRRALESTVDEVGDWCRRHDVDAGYAKGGTLGLARSAVQAERLKAEVAADRRFGGADTRWLEPAEVAERIRVTDVAGAAYTPHCAAIQPAALARGLARVVEERGGRIYEQSAARQIGDRRVVTDRGTVRAQMVVRATEGYTADLPASHREIVPLWSLIVATEPLDDDTWAQLGWGRRETLTDGRHLLVYAQRSADGRVVFGGRGAPYRFGSGTTGRAGHAATFEALGEAMRRMFPALSRARITHRWGGVLGASRDWTPAVAIDQAAGLAWAGGYVGDGVGCAALAGRTLADLVLDRDTDLTRLPWVGHRWPRWEPEPLRWLGIRGSTLAMRIADATEARTGRSSPIASLVGRLTGH
jgi:glycine/D-amino acid oxidase-like deaminating enzyme